MNNLQTTIARVAFAGVTAVTGGLLSVSSAQAGQAGEIVSNICRDVDAVARNQSEVYFHLGNGAGFSENRENHVECGCGREYGPFELAVDPDQARSENGLQWRPDRDDDRDHEEGFTVYFEYVEPSPWFTNADIHIQTRVTERRHCPTPSGDGGSSDPGKTAPSLGDDKGDGGTTTLGFNGAAAPEFLNGVTSTASFGETNVIKVAANDVTFAPAELALRAA